MDMKKFGSFLAELRKEKGLTQAQLAARLNVTDKAVSRWERGVGYPDVNSFEPLAKALEVSVLELMQGQRRPGGEVPCEEADKAVTDAVSMVSQQREMDRMNLLVGFACLLMVLPTALVVGLSHLVWVIVFYCCVAGAAIGWNYYRRDREDEVTRKICRGVMLIAAAVGVASLIQLVPEILMERYADLLILLLTAYWVFIMVRQLFDLFRNRDRQKPLHVVLLALFTAAVLALCLFSVHRQVSRITGEALEQRQNLVYQYAQALVLHDCDIEPEDVTAHLITTGAPDGEYPDRYAVVFQYRNGAGEKGSYGYEVALSQDMTFHVLEQGRGVGADLLTVAEVN